MKRLFIAILLLFVFRSVFTQEVKYIQLLNADSLVAQQINGENVRILFGNVHMSQDDITIFCDRAIQYLESNKADLEGNVRVKQKNVHLSVPSGTYDGMKKVAYGKSGVRLFDGKVNLNARQGTYLFKEQVANFNGSVRLCDDSTNLLSDNLIYYPNLDKSIATGSVSIEQKEDFIYSDTLVNFRNNRFSVADGNVRIDSKKNNLKIYSDHLKNYEQSSEAVLTGNTLLIRIDTVDYSMLDTLIISCDSIYTQRSKDNERYFAYNTVKIWRNGFSSNNELTLFYRNENKILTYKTNKDSNPPVFWKDDNQVFGDSIIFYTEKNSIRSSEIFGDPFIISRDTINPDKYNQLTGNFIKIDFNNGEIDKVLLKGRALSMYFGYEENKPNGLNKSSADSMLITFTEKQINSINLYGSSEGEYHPEELVEAKEKDFRLGGFRWYAGRPEKSELLKKRKLSD